MISQIEIYNFRSIKELVLTPDSLNAIIGPNSTGKTNVLKALDLVLGEGWTTKAKVARELFNDPGQEVKIIVSFSSPVSVDTNRGGQKEINSIELTMALTPEFTAKTTCNDGQTFYEQAAFKKLCHFVYIPSERNLVQEMRVSQWTMLGKMMRAIYENYVQHYGDDEKLKGDFAEAMEPAKTFLEADFSEADLTFKKFSETFIKNCKKNSVGLANDFEPSLDIYNLNWFYKTLQIHVKEKGNDLSFDSEEVGSGMKNLLMLSIFQTYSELVGDKVIFGIEEPEIYLYPHAQRALYKNLISLSETSQIFYTTHNPNFVSAARPQDVIILRKDVEEGTYFLEKSPLFSKETAESYWHKIYTNFNNERNEIFFSNKVILVEGASDKVLLETLCSEKWDVDLDECGYSIVECGGKNGVKYFVGVAKLIGLDDYYAVWDQDEEVLHADDLLKEVLDNEKGFEFLPDMESALGIEKGSGDEKVLRAHEWASSINVADIPALFSGVKIFLSENENEE